MASSSLVREHRPGAGAWAKRLGLTALLLGLSAAAVVPFFYLGESFGSRRHGGEMPVTHDLVMHYNQMKSFYAGLASGEVYPRWQEETNHGYGAPTTLYYPPGVYYLTSACYFLLRDWTRALVGTYLLLMVASAAAVYLCARQVMSGGAATWAAAAYIVWPYHLINQYQRGAIAEQLSFVWMPLAWYFTTRLFQPTETEQAEGRAVPWWAPPELVNFLGLAASYGAFVWSHPPTAYQFTLVLALAVIGLGVRRRDGRGVLWAGGGLAFGLLLGAAYLYPAVMEQGLINSGDVAETWPYQTTYVFDYANWRFDHVKDDFIVRIDHIWLLNTAALTLAAAVWLTFRRAVGDGSRQLKESVIGWAVVGGCASLMMTPASAPLGRLIPKLEVGVFSWRMLSITTFFVALLAGACAEAAQASLRWRRIAPSKSMHPELEQTVSRQDAKTRQARQGRLSLRSLLLGVKYASGSQVSPGELVRCSAFGSVSVLILFAGTAFSVVRVARPMYRAEAFRPIPEHFNYATVPRGAPRSMPEAERAELAAGRGSVSVERWDPEHRALRVELMEADQLFVRTFNFPGWSATVDGRPARVRTGVVGNLLLDLPAGSHTVRLDFLPTPARQVGSVITTAAFGLLLLLLFVSIAGRVVKRRPHYVPARAET